MKLKKYLSSLLALTLLASCSNDGILDNNTPIDSVPEGAVAFNVSLPGRTFEPATYAEIPNAEDFEKSVAGGVRIYVFDNAGATGKLIATERVDQITGVNTETGVVGKFYMRNFLGQAVHMVAAANLDLTAEQANALLGKTFAEFSKMIITQSPSAPNKFPMVSEPLAVNVPKQGNPSVEISFVLERLAVRVDIDNLTRDDNSAETKKMTITHARLRNVNKNQSYLVKGQTDALAPNDATGTWVANTASVKEKMYALVYTYENAANTNTILDIKGTIGTATVQFEIPFEKKTVRNTRYLVKVKNVGKGNKVEFEVNVVDWKEGGNVTIDSDNYGKQTKPVFKSFSVANASGVAQTTGQAHNLTATNTQLSLTSTNAYNTRLVLNSLYDLQVKVNGAIVPWITVKKVNTTTVEDNEFGNQAFHIAFAKNFDTYARTAELVIEPKDNIDPAKRYTIAVNQVAVAYGAVENPLAILSDRYVGTVGNFATKASPMEDVQDKDAWGMWYQWGRNNPINPKLAVLTNATQLAKNDTKLNTNTPANTAYGKGKASWTTEVLTTSTTWQGLVMSSGFGNTYTGTNSVAKGDPSPEGYKLPNKSELGAIIYSNNMLSYAVDLPNNSENGISFLTAKNKNYKAAYKGNGSNVIYAIRMKEGEANRYLTAFRYELRKNTVVITARHLGAAGVATTIATVATEAWWNDATKAGSDIVRVYQKATPARIFGAFANQVNSGSSQGTFILAHGSHAGVGHGTINQLLPLLPIRAK